VKHGRPLRRNIRYHAHQQRRNRNLSRYERHIPYPLHSAEIVTAGLPMCWAAQMSRLAADRLLAMVAGRLMAHGLEEWRRATARLTRSSFRGARRASLESILPIVVMDSGLATSSRPGMTLHVWHDLAFPRHVLPEPCMKSSPLQNERVQGMPGEGLTHGPPATRKAGGSHHRWCRSSGIPCAAVYDLYEVSPGTGLFAPVCA
jgi:hypothetical protein